MSAKIGILTVSDRAYRGVYEDLGGPAIQEYLSEVLTNDWDAIPLVVPDEFDQIKAALISLVDDEACSLVVTTGGTGPAVRDITPDATEAVCQKMMPGDDARLRRIDAAGVAAIRADCDPLAADGGHTGHGADRQFARQAQRHPRLSGCGYAGDPLLHRLDQGRISDHGRSQNRGVQAQVEIADRVSRTEPRIHPSIVGASHWVARSSYGLCFGRLAASPLHIRNLVCSNICDIQVLTCQALRLVWGPQKRVYLRGALETNEGDRAPQHEEGATP